MFANASPEPVLLPERRTRTNLNRRNNLDYLPAGNLSEPCLAEPVRPLTVLQPPASEALAVTSAAIHRSGLTSLSLVDQNPASFLSQAAAVVSPLHINKLPKWFSGCFF
ncbi:hypothetical protein CHARACLAT_020082 [Characodon lateralis]|uniref:Uncharacterized protein n=1 Tax=Characodon lateralis TaxID=208331 RepID=A0ABU7F4G0_9TELE|nr:hypothetical protein [Characodon lateralis]